MRAAGVKVSLGAVSDQPRYAPQYASNLLGLTKVPGASGLNLVQAFAAISLGNRQTRLRDRYNNPGEGDLPKTYE